MSSCTACDPGLAQSSEGSSSCFECFPGTFSLRSADRCRACPVGKIAPLNRTEECTECDPNATPDANRVKCICRRGYFLPVRKEGASVNGSSSLVTKCERCEAGMACEEPGTEESTMKTAEGYWRSSEDDSTFYSCVLPRHCRSGRPFECADNRGGPLCAVCFDGYRPAVSGAGCEKCPSKSGAVGESVGFSLLVLVSLAALCYAILWKDRNLMKVVSDMDVRELQWDEHDDVFRSAIQQGQSKSILDSWQNPFDEIVGQAPNKNLEELGLAPLVPKLSNAPSVTYKLKIVVSFFQIITNVAVNAEIPYPSHFRSFVSFFEFVSMDFLPWKSIGCSSGIDYYDKLVISTLSPMFVVILLAVFLSVPVFKTWRALGRHNAKFTASVRQASTRMLKLVIFLLFMMWPNVSRVTLSLFVCREVEGKSYLLEDMSLECYTSKWYSYLIYVIVMIAIYLLGVPLFFLGVIYKKRNELTHPRNRLRYGFLYEAYTKQSSYFELVDMANKLTVVSIVRFLPVSWQLPISLATILAYFVSLLLLSPYVRKGDDRLSLLAYTEIMLFFILGLVLLQSEQSSGQLDDSSDDLGSAMLILITCGFVCCFSVITGLNAKKLLQKFYENWKNSRLTDKKEKSGSTDSDDTDGVEMFERERRGSLSIEFRAGRDGSTVVHANGAVVGFVEEDEDETAVIRTSSASMFINPLLSKSMLRQSSVQSLGDVDEESEDDGCFSPNPSSPSRSVLPRHSSTSSVYRPANLYRMSSATSFTASPPGDED